MTYFKYVERDVKDQINWAEVGKGVTDMLKAETVARENEKQKIKDRSRAFGEQLSNSPTGDYDAGNTFIGDFSNHYGIFEGCGKSMPFTSSEESSSCC